MYGRVSPWRSWRTATLLLGVVHAQTPPSPSPEKKTSYAPVDIKETFASIMARMSAAKDAVMRRQMDLLAQRYDLSNRAGRGREDVPREGHPGRRARPPARGHDLGAARGHGAGPDPRPRRVPGRLQAPAAREPPRRRDALPEVPHRRGQPAGAARPHALRPRLRHPRALPARVPARRSSSPRVPTSATSRRASSSPSTTSTRSSTGCSIPRTSKACACW